MRLRRRQSAGERLRHRVADSVARAEVSQRVGQRVADTADRIAGRVHEVAADARGNLAAIEPPMRRRHSHRRGGFVAAALVLVAAVAVGVAWWRRHHRDEEYARLADTPDDPFAGPAAPSSPDGATANSNDADASAMSPPAVVATAPTWEAPAEREPQGAPASPWNRAPARSEARLASRSLFDSSTTLPHFDAIKPPVPRFDPPGSSYGKFAP